MYNNCPIELKIISSFLGTLVSEYTTLLHLFGLFLLFEYGAKKYHNNPITNTIICL